MEIVEFDPRRDEPDEESESLPCAAWNRSGSTHPIVTLRTSGRELHHYHRLARALGPDQPLYSLGHCVGTSSEPVPDSQDKWATHFVGLLGELDLGDNLILGGWSNSGIVSLDVAHRLAQLGRPPAVVVLFDSRRPRPDTEGRRVWAKWTGENLVNWACSPTKEERRALVRYKTTRPLNKLRDRLGERIRVWRHPDAAPSAQRFRGHHRTDDPLILANRRVYRSWTPRLFDVPTIQLWTGLTRTRLDGDAAQGMTSLLVGPYVQLKVPGDHHSMWESPHVDVLADQVNLGLVAISVVTADVPPA